jgi:hypothetical protein
MTTPSDEEIFIGKLAGQVIGYTGSEPYSDIEIEKAILEENGIIGEQGIWQQEQVIVVGNVAFDRAYLLESFEIGRKFGFVCRYMSQEDFLNSYLQGEEVRYSLNDPRIRNHRGLSFLASSKHNWPEPVPTHRVNWKILPPGEHPFPRILNHFKQLQLSDKTLKIDEERLQFIHSLGPSGIYVGTDEFKRYIIFYFADLEKAVLKCPIFGNAIYVIDGEWELLSQYTKADLLWDFPDDVTRIIHSGDWSYRLKKVLGI